MLSIMLLQSYPVHKSFELCYTYLYIYIRIYLVNWAGVVFSSRMIYVMGLIDPWAQMLDFLKKKALVISGAAE